MVDPIGSLLREFSGVFGFFFVIGMGVVFHEKTTWAKCRLDRVTPSGLFGPLRVFLNYFLIIDWFE